MAHDTIDATEPTDVSESPGGRTALVTVFVVGGTGESFVGDTRTEVSGLLRAVTDELDERFLARWIAYPASYGPAPHARGISFEHSVHAGAVALGSALDGTPGAVMFIGYSQGAVVIREALHMIARQHRSAIDLARILGVGLVADPHQPPGVVTGCDGWGVAGPGLALPDHLPVYWVGDPRDVICNASPDSLIRDIADLTSAMTLSGVAEWRHSVAELLRGNSFQNAQQTAIRPAQWRADLGRVRTAAREALGYLPRRIGWGSRMVRNRLGGRHTSYAWDPYRRAPVTNGDATACQDLAGWMQVQATFTVGHPSAA